MPGHSKAGALLLVAAILVVACGGAEPVTAPPSATSPGPPTAPVAVASPLPTTSPVPTATSVPTASPAPTASPQPTESGAATVPFDGRGGGVIAFYSERDGNVDVYAMNADGSGLLRLTDDPAFDDSPALSPDGSQIAFLTSRHDPQPTFPFFKYELYVMDIDGGNVRRLTETEGAETHPAWSPDGSRLSFDADYDGDGYYEIYAIDADGSNLTRLTANAANDQFADWSPDGTQLAFSSDRSGNWDLYVMDADGGNQRPLTAGPDWELFPAWSPDGTQIAFNGLKPNSRNTDVYVMNADGSDVRQLTDTPRFDENPAWSPDGSRIAFQTERAGSFALYTMNADGSDQRPLMTYSGDSLWPSWGPAAASSASALSMVLSDQDFGRTGPFQIGLGDLDGDGDLDAVFANTQSNYSQVWLNDGGVQGGTPGQFTDSGQQLTQYGHGVGLGDWDGDGDLDLFITCHFFVTPSKVYLNDGQGVFQQTDQDLHDADSSGVAVNLVDVDGDGHLDVHVAYYDPTGRPDKVYLGDGSGSFRDSGLALDEYVIAWGDLDSDGDADYLGKRFGEGYVVQLNDGGGRFSVGWTMADEQAIDGGMTLADLDGDGDLDAVIANSLRAGAELPTLVLWNDGSGQFSDSGQRLNATAMADLGVGDLDGDGDLDLFVVNAGQPHEVWLNDGAGRLVDSGLRLEGPPGNKVDTVPTVGDVDGDGDLDVFVGSLGGTAELWLNGSAPTAPSN